MAKVRSWLVGETHNLGLGGVVGLERGPCSGQVLSGGLCVKTWGQ